MKHTFSLFLLIIFSALGTTACLSGLDLMQEARTAPYVNLHNLQPLPTPVESEIVPLRVAIAAVISPKGSLESYAPMLEYLSKKLNRPVETIQRRTYAEINDLLRTGEVDLAFVCTSSYIVGKREFDLQLLVAPLVQGESYYHAQIIVPAGSPAQTLEDLRGGVFAFTDPMSFTGRMYPTYLLKQVGETPDTFFTRTFFTYSHDDAIYAISQNLADGASVDSLVLDFVLKRDPEIASKIRVIHTSPPFGIPPVVISPHTRPKLRAHLQELFLNMNQESTGREALAAIDAESFIAISDEDYQSVREIEEEVRSDIFDNP